MLLPQEIIRKKRDGGTLEPEEIEAFIRSFAGKHVGGAQIAAFAMAVFFRGMNTKECAALTRAMMQSGQVLDWSKQDLGGPVLDKHSTGGVGDNVSLVLAPAIAACGGFVPMISGRGLGHTGGTLDKLEAIPGYATKPDPARLLRTLRAAGCAIIGQTAELAPADARFYAVRDITATVESIPLITASILSKKLAAGLDGLVMDVKSGSGAFMPTFQGAQELARSIVDVATRAGLPAVALITDMDQPLASAAGNALETAHAIAHLTGARREPRLQALVVALGAEMLLLGGLARDLADGRARIEDALASGKAAAHFARMVAALGGASDLIERPEAILPQAHIITPLLAPRDGFVTRLATREIGLCVVALGGGRASAKGVIDPSVGLTGLPSRGQYVTKGEPLAVIHASSEAKATHAASLLRDAITLGEAAPTDTAPVLARLVASPD